MTYREEYHWAMCFNATEKKSQVLVANELAKGGSCILSLAIATLTTTKKRRQERDMASSDRAVVEIGTIFPAR